MPIQKRNAVMHGTSGKFMDQLVFRNRAGKTVICAPPLIKEDRVPTPGQLVIQEKFKACIRYAKAAIKNLLLKAGYASAAENGQSAYNVAFADCYNGPVVLSINKDKYLGQADDLLKIEAIDNFKVTLVKVSIHSAAGELVEQGDAVLDAEGLFWEYAVSGENENAIGSKIKATAYDLPGNEGSLEITV